MLAIQLRELAGDLPRVAWYQGSGCRPTVSDDPSDISRLSGDWAQLTAAAGCEVIPITQLDQLNHLPQNLPHNMSTSPTASLWRAVVIPGPSTGLSEEERTQLNDFLRHGGRVLLALDSSLAEPLHTWQQWLAPHGISWSQQRLVSEQHHRVAGLSQLAHASAYGEGSQWPHPRVLQVASSDTITTWVRSDIPSVIVNDNLRSQQHRSLPLAGSISLMEDLSQHGGQLAIAASVDAFNPQQLADPANRAIVRDITAWLCQFDVVELNQHQRKQ